MVELIKHESGFGRKGVLAYSRNLPQETAKFILIIVIFRSNFTYAAFDIMSLYFTVLCTCPVHRTVKYYKE
jgi:hypothetical protein